jgi:hypothetical protein
MIYEHFILQQMLRFSCTKLFKTTSEARAVSFSVAVHEQGYLATCHRLQSCICSQAYLVPSPACVPGYVSQAAGSHAESSERYMHATSHRVSPAFNTVAYLRLAKMVVIMLLAL